MKKNIILCLLVISAMTNSHVLAEIPEVLTSEEIFCDLLEAHDYEILDYSIPSPSEIDPKAPQVIQEYGVAYNLTKMPLGYEVPTEMKIFAMENKINGVAIVPGHEGGSEGIFAEIVRTNEKKIVLFVTHNLVQDPESIVKVLMGVTKTQDIQRQELRSVIEVGDEDKGWMAGLAKMMNKGVEKVTGGDSGTTINFDKINIEESGSFVEMFGEEKVTLTIGDQGPYEIEMHEMENAILSAGNNAVNLFVRISFKDKSAPYTDILYISDDGGLYGCHAEK